MPNDEPEICQSTDVIVDGRIVARSIFAEFETKIDRPLRDLVQVLNPKSWPTYSAPLIRQMDPIDPVAPWPPASPNPWRQSFKEYAELGTETLTNVLQFDFSLSETYFALTFDLAHSVDGKLDLDRGYFLINDGDGRRRVQALKVIRFVPGHESDLSRFLVDQACPMWGDWIKAIIQAQPVASARNATGSEAAADPADLARLGAVIYRDRLLELVDTCANTYGDYVTDVTSRLANGGYGVSDAIGDAVRLGWHWGLDWARVSTNVLEFVTAMGQEAQPERGAPGLRGLRPIEHTVWPLDGRDPPVEAADLRSISPGGAVLGRNRIRLIPATVGRDPAVRVLVDTWRVPYGMYVGKFKVSGDDVPFQFYVSRTAPVSS